MSSSTDVALPRDPPTKGARVSNEQSVVAEADRHEPADEIPDDSEGQGEGSSAPEEEDRESNREEPNPAEEENGFPNGNQPNEPKSPPPKLKSSSRLNRHLSNLKGWTLELWASLLSVAAFISIIVVLKEYDDRPQTTWSYSYLTLNGLIALLASITRAALGVAIAAAIGQGKWNWFVRGADSSKSRQVPERRLGDLEAFDEASRGAWGSLKLLKRLRCWHLCSIGAVLTMLVLGFDTFAQQVITIDVRDVPDLRGALPQVPRSQYYDGSNFISDTMQEVLVATLPMKSAIYNGIMNQNLTELPIACSTGNCTWPIIPTIAVCGACVDLTPNITKHCTSKYCNYTLPIPEVSSSIAPPPGEYLLDGQIRDEPYSLYSPLRTFYEVFTPFEPLSTEWSKTIPEVPSYIALFLGLGAEYRAQDMSKVTASECALWLCLQALNVSTENGISTSKEIKTWSQAEASDIFDYNFTNIPFEEFNIPKGTQYGSFKGSLEAIGDTVANYTGGQVTGFQEAGVPGPQLWSYDFSSDTMQAFWQGSADYTAFIQNLATSISDRIRLTVPVGGPPPNNTRYAGTAFSSQPYAHVRWPWLTYPASILVASLVFLFVTIDRTRRRKMRVWKGSATALLFSRVDGDDVRLWDQAEMHAEDGSDLAHAVDDYRIVVTEERGFWVFNSI